MLTSRVFLGIALLFALLAVWALAWTWAYAKRYTIMVIGAIIMTYGAYALDRGFSMPHTGDNASEQDKQVEILTKHCKQLIILNQSQVTNNGIAFNNMPPTACIVSNGSVFDHNNQLVVFAVSPETIKKFQDKQGK